MSMARQIRYLLEELQQICNELKDENELDILEHYGLKAKRDTIIITLFSMCGLFLVIIQPIWQHIFTTSAFINIHQPRITIQEMIYSVKREMYFYLKLLHMITAVCVGATVLTATGTMLMVYAKHICGMFRIASYRFEQAMEIDILESINLTKEITIYKGIIYAVDIHRKAMEYAKFLISNFERSVLLLTIFIVTCLSCNLYRTSQIVSFEGDIQQLALHSLLIGGLLIYMFLANYIAQEITDHNNHIFLTVYNVPWYTAPLCIQRIILFLLQRGTKAFHLQFGGILVGSLETFSMLVSTSVSYFTVLYATQTERKFHELTV